MKVWVLTFEANDYNQHGEYFEAVFKEKPTAIILAGEAKLSLEKADELLNNGRIRLGYESGWYILEEVEAI